MKSVPCCTWTCDKLFALRVKIKLSVHWDYEKLTFIRGTNTSRFRTWLSMSDVLKMICPSADVRDTLEHDHIIKLSYSLSVIPEGIVNEKSAVLL